MSWLSPSPRTVNGGLQFLPSSTAQAGKHRIRRSAMAIGQAEPAIGQSDQAWRVAVAGIGGRRREERPGLPPSCEANAWIDW